jgi:hypothetical protein
MPIPNRIAVVASGRRLSSLIGNWFEHVDPGTHRRIKGLRLVTAFGLAAMLATMPEISDRHTASLGALAAGFALWASVSEARTTRFESARDLVLLCLAAGIGAASFAILGPRLGPAWAELTLVSGSFCVGYFKRFGVVGTGVGSQIFIGQLLSYNADMTAFDLGTIAVATGLATLASVVPRILSGPAEQPALDQGVGPTAVDTQNDRSPEIIMGLQAAAASLAIVLLGQLVGLTQSAWAIAACTYVVANSAAGTIDRVRRRVAGTLIGVPLGLICLPMVGHAPLVIWIAAAVAMIVYAMALPEHYEVACGAYAFALIVTMAANGEHSVTLLAARGWETILGGAIGIAVVFLLVPLSLHFGSSNGERR